mmetsp:Transcript_17485/g.50378  ORF Transcript_17485/g.50378 Transcript_17485/m.50378 type:complete len:259 (-) Transcript_17485:410-1186(-)
MTNRRRHCLFHGSFVEPRFCHSHCLLLCPYRQLFLLRRCFHYHHPHLVARWLVPRYLPYPPLLFADQNPFPDEPPLHHCSVGWQSSKLKCCHVDLVPPPPLLLGRSQNQQPRLPFSHYCYLTRHPLSWILFLSVARLDSHYPFGHHHHSHSQNHPHWMILPCLTMPRRKNLDLPLPCLGHSHFLARVVNLRRAWENSVWSFFVVVLRCRHIPWFVGGFRISMSKGFLAGSIPKFLRRPPTRGWDPSVSIGHDSISNTH